MAIRLIEGVPGSGKTYYAVAHLVKNYFEKQADGRYELVKPCTIITNIENFKPNHISLLEVMKEAGGANIFFTEPYQIVFSKRFEHQIVYIIDEVQQFFRKGDRSKELHDVFYYFEKHRHLGHDIYLITQNVKKLPTDITTLVEYIIIAAPRSRSVIGEFKYKWDSDGIVIKREGLKPDKGIFALYKSMDIGESEKVKSPLMKTVFISSILCVIVGGFLIYKLWWYFIGKNKEHLHTEKPPTSINTNSSTFVSNPDKFYPKDGNFRDFIEVPLSFVREVHFIDGMQRENIIFFLGKLMYPREGFPFPVREYRGKFIARIPKALYEEMNKEPETTRTAERIEPPVDGVQ